jgi:putative FmdB family regulatory protein
MPIFEYRCRDCEERFELLVRSDTTVACPKCSGKKVDKLLSVFAAHAGHGRESMPACHTGHAGCNLGKCGSGLCGVD